MKRDSRPDDQIVDISQIEQAALGPIVVGAPTIGSRDDYWSTVTSRSKKAQTDSSAPSTDGAPGGDT